MAAALAADLEFPVLGRVVGLPLTQVCAVLTLPRAGFMNSCPARED